jgi:type I restriction enzyme, S subunit
LTVKQVSEFKEMAELIKDHFTPSKDNPIAYLGLEHIEQQTLRISSIGKSSDITSQKLQFKKNDILFGKLRPYFRKVVRPNFDGICSTDIFVVRAKKGISQSFLYYVMASNEFVNYSSQGTQGTKMPRASWDFLEKYEQFTPTLEKQERIGKILSDLDAKIENLQNQNHTLEQMVQAIFQSWFVNFDGVTEWDDSELGLIPKGWTIKNIGMISDVTKLAGYEFTKFIKYDKNGEIIALRSLNVLDGRLDLKNIKKIPKKVSDLLPRSKLFKNDILLTYTGRIGYVALIDENEKYHLAPNVCRLRTSEKYFSLFLYSYLKSSIFKFFLSSYLVGTSQPTIPMKNIRAIPIIIPKNEYILESFYALSNAIHKKINQNQINLEILEQTRDALLPKLMSGEIRV